MNKLSDMLDENIEELDVKLQEKFASRITDKAFFEVVQGLEVQDLHLNILEIEKVIEEKVNCKKCESLETCCNEIDGHYFHLSVLNNSLVEEYVMCDKKKSLDYLKNIYLYGRDVESFSESKKVFPDKNRTEVVKYIQTLLDVGKLGKGIYLHGSFGTGKSFLMDTLIKKLAKQGYRCGSVYFPELLVNIRGSYSYNSDSDDILNQIKNLDVLVIDDIGSEKMTAWSRDEVLGTIVQYRMDHKLFTCFTSNYNYGQLLKHYSADGQITNATRVLDRIKVLTMEFMIKGKNYRSDS